MALEKRVPPSLTPLFRIIAGLALAAVLVCIFYWYYSIPQK
jgi:hypothetical protein